MRAWIIAALLLGACTAEPPKPPEPPTSPQAARALATVATPVADSRVFSPLVATGIAPGDWYFEAVFVAKLVGADGAVIAEAPARAQTDWTTPGDKTFMAELPFTVAADTPATLILQEDMPREGEEPREVRVPVVLTAE